MQNPNAATKRMLPTMTGIKTSGSRNNTSVDGNGGVGDGEGGGDGETILRCWRAFSMTWRSASGT